MDPEQAGGRELTTTKTWFQRFVLGLLLLLVVAFCFFESISHPSGIEYGYTTEFYQLLARGFLRGSTALPVTPKPEMFRLRDPYDPYLNVKYRLHDASFYHGKYYLYFGVTPAVTLFVPFRLITGRDLPNRVGVAFFCAAGYLISCALFFVLAAHNRWSFPFWLQCVVVLSLGSMSLISLLLRRPSFYEVPIAAGYFFVGCGFFFLALAVFHGLSESWSLFLAGVMFGSAVGCRPHFVLVCAIVLIAFAIRSWVRPVLIVWLAAGMAVCAVPLGWYNYARFENPLEFGRTYQLTMFPNDETSRYHGLELNPEGILRSAEDFLFLPPALSKKAPFIHMTSINPLPARPGPALWYEDAVGLTLGAPLALLGLIPLFWSGAFVDRWSNWLLYTMYVCSMTLFVLLSVVGWVLSRYLVDFVPLWTFLGLVAVVVFWQKTSIRRGVQVFAIAATIYAVAVNVALAIPN